MNARRRHGSRSTEQGVYLGPSHTQALPPRPPAASAPPEPLIHDIMSCRDRTNEFMSACKSLQGRQNGVPLNKPSLTAVKQRSDFTLMAKRIGKDLSNTFAKLEKMTIRKKCLFI
ncbi:syntaxin-5 [Huso huso]|uniref:Syntaxin-5 n=1 Tax=Huso huso TaxID=61971 RepID=A0ABR0YYL7_HUSHU